MKHSQKITESVTSVKLESENLTKDVDGRLGPGICGASQSVSVRGKKGTVYWGPHFKKKALIYVGKGSKQHGFQSAGNKEWFGTGNTRQKRVSNLWGEISTNFVKGNSWKFKKKCNKISKNN